MRLRRLDHGPAQSRQRCGTKISGHGEIFFQKQRICLDLVTMTCQFLTRILGGSSRLPDSDAQHQFRRIEPRDFQAHARRIFEKRHPEIAVWLFQIPCSRVQIPCSFAEIPCSAK